jgi:hypothetical protein
MVAVLAGSSTGAVSNVFLALWFDFWALLLDGRDAKL